MVIPYSDSSQRTVLLGKEQVEVVTAPGLPHLDQVLPSTCLLAEHALIHSVDFVLIYGCFQGALCAYLARKLSNGHLYIFDHNFTALDATSQTLVKNRIPIESVKFQTEIDLPQALHQKFDAVLIQIPKGRLLTRKWLVQAYHALHLGGNLYITGSNKLGIQSIIKDSENLFGPGEILAYRKGNRISRHIKNSNDALLPGWANAPGISPNTWVEYSITIQGQSYLIRSLPGVFSYDHLDEGTEMLLNAIKISPGESVLDVGCGYGMIGIYAASHGAGLVHLIDNDLLAIASCKEVIKQNNIPTTMVFVGNLLYPVASNKYDLVLSNPPFHSGGFVDYQIAHSMIEQAYQVLNPGGRLVIVANRFIRYDRLIQDIFGNITYLAESGKFHVLSGLKSS